MATAARPDCEAIPRISFVVLSFNSGNYIESCIRSIVSTRPHGADQGGDEIWVVDNGSVDGTRRVLAVLERELPNLHVILLPENIGTTASRNMALKQVRGKYVAIIDSDVQVLPGTIDGLVQTLEADLSCGIVAPRLEFPDGRLQLSTDVFPTLQHKFRRFLMLRQMERGLSRQGAGGTRPVDIAISAFWLMRRELFDAVGLLDERIFYSPEDVDYCLRVWKAGYRVIYVPSARAIHDAQEISRTRIPTRATFSHAAGLGYLFLKHRYVLSRRSLYRQISRAAGRSTGHGDPRRKVVASS